MRTKSICGNITIMKNDYFNLGPETEQIEYKKSTGEIKEGVISIASILNKHGKGELYFGIKNNGEVIGQNIGDDTLRSISQAIGNHLTPTIYPTITAETVVGKSVVLVKFEGSRQPYLAYRVPRIRVSDEDLVMDQDTYEEMLKKRNSASNSWETQPSKYKISDIDNSVFSRYLKKAKNAGRINFETDDTTEAIKLLELCDGDTLLNAGAALFVDCGINELQMAKFASDERLTFTDIRRFTGSIISLADKAVQYVIDAMDWRVEFHGKLERTEIPEIPVDAIREAVINAFAHRLIQSGQSVEVAVYRSFIEIYSPGEFPSGMTPEMYINEIHKPYRRNPLVTRTLYYSQDMESFATGLKHLKELCDEVDCKVEFYGDSYGFTVRFYRHCGEGWADIVSTSENNGNTTTETTTKTTTETTTKNTSRQKLLQLIVSNPYITAEEMALSIGLSKDGVQYHIKKLKKEGILEREGSSKSGKWTIKGDFT